MLDAQNKYSSDSDENEDYDEDIIEFQIRKSDKHNARNEITYNHLLDKADFSLKNEVRKKDKSNRCTTEGVLDRRSLNIIFKLMNQELFDEVEGCISTGKEANVYRAVRKNDADLVIKVYGTSVMKFKNRNQYMEGDFRLKNAMYKGSNTKVVKKWSEKENRNLKRICKTNGAIPCPIPIVQKSMVLVMTMIGSEDNPAPRLKDVVLDETDDVSWDDLYFQVVRMTRILFQDCKLVHADLSEYNLLYCDNKIYMIDVSQSVEHEHPNVIKFLLKDCSTINDFFRKKGVKTLLLQEYFAIVVDIKFGSHEDEDFDNKLMEFINETKYPAGVDDENYFSQSYIPRKLGDIDCDNFLKDYKALIKNPNHVDNMPFLSIVGLKDEFQNIRHEKQQEKKRNRQLIAEKLAKLDIESEEVEAQSSDAEIVSESEEKMVTTKDKPDENVVTNAERKKLIKQERKIKRMQKKDQKLKWDMRTKNGVKKKSLNFPEDE